MVHCRVKSYLIGTKLGVSFNQTQAFCSEVGLTALLIWNGMEPQPGWNGMEPQPGWNGMEPHPGRNGMEPQPGQNGMVQLS